MYFIYIQIDTLLPNANICLLPPKYKTYIILNLKTRFHYYKDNTSSLKKN